MKSKGFKYFMIVAVVAIWVTIVYKIVDYSGGDDIPLNLTSETNRKDTLEVFTDTFTLIANYRDPFLDRYAPRTTPVVDKNNNTVKEKKQEIKVEKEKQTEAAPWPKLSYHGLIVNNKSSTRTGLMKVNGRDVIIQQGLTYSLVEVISLNNDSVIVKYLGEKRSFKKQ